MTGDLEKTSQAYNEWALAYPRDFIPRNNLAVTSIIIGDVDKSMAETKVALKIEPGNAAMYSSIAQLYLYKNRIEEAKAGVADALSKNLDSPALHNILYQIALLESDSDGMAKQMAWSKGQPGVEDGFLSTDSGAKAYLGQIAKSRELTRRAAESAVGVGEKETAAGYIASDAIREALIGDAVRARQQSAAALAMSTGRDVQALAALAYAVTNDLKQAQTLADDLSKRFPLDTLVQSIYLPLIHALTAISRNEPAKAIEALAPYAKYDLTTTGLPLLPFYVRGTALLEQKKGPEAAAEFQKLLDNRNINLTEVLPALAQLGLARAYALSGDSSKARTAYQDFLALWKDADPDVPILKQAKSEYAKLQ